MHASSVDLLLVSAPLLLRASLAFWIVTGSVALVVLAASVLRIVPEHERMIVRRRGRVVRVQGPGLVFRIPFIERLTGVSLRPAELPLLVSATTRDGVPVRLLACGECRVSDAALSATASPDPLTATANVLESRLAEKVSDTKLPALLPTREQLESCVPAEVTAVTAAWGVEVSELHVSDIETWLTADLLRSLHWPAKAGDR